MLQLTREMCGTIFKSIFSSQEVLSHFGNSPSHIE